MRTFTPPASQPLRTSSVTFSLEPEQSSSASLSAPPLAPLTPSTRCQAVTASAPSDSGQMSRSTSEGRLVGTKDAPSSDACSSVTGWPPSGNRQTRKTPASRTGASLPMPARGQETTRLRYLSSPSICAGLSWGMPRYSESRTKEMNSLMTFEAPEQRPRKLFCTSIMWLRQRPSVPTPMEPGFTTAKSTTKVVQKFQRTSSRAMNQPSKTPLLTMSLRASETVPARESVARPSSL
mmetsp:Transcript_37743/g.117658  ORF Transcript_37743/g.117658 Transcript_37743/m.117658 type:complete len:236 (+) Transcript_37743:740-1447(+)